MRQPKPTHEKRKLQLSPNNNHAVWIYSNTHRKGTCIFTKFKLCAVEIAFYEIKKYPYS